MNYKKLKRFFEGEHPSVKRFIAKTALLPPQERRRWLHTAFDAALHNWEEANSEFQSFLVNLTKSNRQSFLDYLHRGTVMGSLRFKVENPILLRKVVWLLEGGVRERKSSSWDLCSSLLYGMDFGLKVNSLHQYMRTNTFTTDDMVELLEFPFLF